MASLLLFSGSWAERCWGMIVSKQEGLKGALLLLALVVVAVLTSLFYAPRADAANLTVTSNEDSSEDPSPGTLRAAVNTANSNGEADTITFDLPEGNARSR